MNVKKQLELIIIVISMFATTTTVVNAGEFVDKFDVNLISWHSGLCGTEKCNEINPGFGVTKDLDHHWSGSVGFYENSHSSKDDRKISVYALVNFNHRMSWYSIGVRFGFVSGYDNIRKYTTTTSCTTYDPAVCEDTTTHNGVRNLDKYQFIVTPTFTAHVNKRHALLFSAIPAIDSTSVNVIGAQYQYTFGE